MPGAGGFSTSTGMLITGRLIQGVMAALMVPQILSTIQILYRTYEERRSVSAFYGGLAGVATVTGPIIGAYPDVSTNFWPLWGEFALVCIAVALLATTLQSVIGPMGTLLTVVVVIFFGNPSTGGVNGTAYLPPFWQFLGPILPPWNAMTLIRNTLYFDGNAITQQLVVLGIYAVAGAALVTVFSWGRLLWWRAGTERREPLSPPEEAGIAAIPPA